MFFFFRELSRLLYNTLLHLHPGHFELSGVTRTPFRRLSEPKQYRDDWPRVGHHGLFYGSNLTGDSTVTCHIHRHETVQTTRVEDESKTERKFSGLHQVSNFKRRWKRKTFNLHSFVAWSRVIFKFPLAKFSFSFAIYKRDCQSESNVVCMI